MPSSVLLPSILLPRSAVSLGRFITSIDEPHQDFHTPACDPSPYAAEKKQTHYNSSHSSDQHRNLVSELTSFLSASASKRAKSSIRITAEEVRSYYLTNTTSYFRAAVKDHATRAWLEQAVDEGEDIYLVVGYHTLLNARITESSNTTHSSSGGLVLPVSAALTASGIPLLPPLSDLVDPGVTAGHGGAFHERRSFMAEGEQVCAVQYRRVKLGWFKRGVVDKMALETGTRWKRFDRSRIGGETEEEEMVGVDLEDEDMEAEGAARDKFVAGSGEVFITADEL